jgi:hypothetical protein
MSFDARSRERLQALGRNLPQKLPPPAPRPASAAAAETPAEARPRHRVESEQDPVALFHALMEASPDGSVPPHLLERLRNLEQPGSQAAAGPGGGGSPAPGPGGFIGDPRAAAPGSGPATAAPGRRRRSGGAVDPVRRGSSSDRDLYDAFDDLLRSAADDLPDPAPTNRRAPDPRLQPRPTLRSPRSL